ncbi:hypothetical protein GPJ56_004032 [Histomonas meleagridis]|uniref:uncharacterized protein n=1 Tax=Histomonas meleagridis TaxID=135588 RepID=UPI00355A553F|nr:hypothetical protein GPJ56_004032 [Histomonas meleagridis]KAH0800613.1 hypothetical protein GO595_006366 [Histomonas meleagridis]
MSNEDFEIFDSSLNVHYEGKHLTFKCPVKISEETKNGIRKIQNNINSVIIAPKLKANKEWQLRGGNSQQRLEVLKYILSHTLNRDGKPLFDPSKVYPFPIKYLKYMNYGITSSTVPDDLSKPEFADLNIDKWSKIQKQPTPDLSQYTLPLVLDFMYSTIIISLFGNEEDLDQFEELKREQEVDKKIIIELNIPIRVPVVIKRIPGYKYEFTFADYCQHKAQEICDQITKLIIPTVNKYTTLVTVYSNVDQAEKKAIEKLTTSLKDVDVVVVQDETTIEEDLAKSYVLFISHDMSEEVKSEIQKISKDYFENIRLLQCSRCQCFYSPTQTGEECITGRHKGHQIPFDNGEMEMFDVNEETGEPETYINMSCCGEVLKDCSDPEMCCETVNNGKHIESPNPEIKSEMIFLDKIPDVSSSINDEPNN